MSKINEAIINPEVLDCLKKLLNFTEALCDDVKISKHYPSMEKARYVINKYEAMREPEDSVMTTSLKCRAKEIYKDIMKDYKPDPVREPEEKCHCGKNLTKIHHENKLFGRTLWARDFYRCKECRKEYSLSDIGNRQIDQYEDEKTRNYRKLLNVSAD